MMKIRRLAEKTINRIAAGEVIERPLSVVKELVENSIDAGAQNITIELERGGRNLIIITDDGSGIAQEELPLALERHATSKLNEEDICNITFHGFRGEALPSIASVSRMKIISKYKESDQAWQIEVLGGEIQKIIPASLREGTVIEVRDLFCFTPNRLKFLKSESSEVSACIELINRFALCHINIAFKLISDSKVVLNYKANVRDLAGQDSRVKDILGAEFINNSLKVDSLKEYVSLRGHISLPTYSRKTAAHYLTYVNNRIIRDKFFIGVAKAAYQGLVPHDRYPVLALFIEIDPYEVDVNVHPTKAEVRFRDENFIRGFLISEIRKAIARVGVNQVQSAPKEQSLNKENYVHKAFTQPSLNINTIVPSPSHAGTFERSFTEKKRDAETLQQPYRDEFRVAYNVTPVNFTENKAQETEKKAEGEISFPLGFAKCQINNTYIISEAKDGFIIVDQHAAHERLVLEKMKKQIQENNIKTQPLLVPEVIEVGAAMTEKILEFSINLKKIGIGIERNGLSQIVVREVPYLLGKVDIKGFLIDFCDNIAHYDTVTFLQETLDEVCGNIACHSSIRAGRRLSIEEMNAILREMESTPFSAQCNHGRPTYRKLSLKELENMFERT